MTELVTFGETALRLSPPGSERLETTRSLEVYPGSAGSNVAVAASRLGTDTVWASKLADTPLGRGAVAELQAHDVTTAVDWVDSTDARQALTFFESGSDPRENYVLDDRDGSAVRSAEPGELPMTAVQNSDGVFVSGETVALSDRLVETTEAVLRASGGISAMGVDYRSDLWSTSEARATFDEIFDAVDLLVTSASDARNVLKKLGEPPEIAHGIASEWDFQTVVVTLSGRGALAWHDATIHERDAVETETVDASGQHEAFTGAFLCRRLAGDDVGTALSHGVAAAALARTVPGPVPTVDADEVAQVVEAADEASGRGRRGSRSL